VTSKIGKKWNFRFQVWNWWRTSGWNQLNFSGYSIF
jgi:hypothetical protein